MRYARVVLTAAILALSGLAGAASIRTGEILERTARATLACSQWQAVGMCFWLRCSLIGCSVETSLKVGHYNPDLVVSSYNTLAENPWLEIRKIIGRAQQTATGSVIGELGGLLVGSAGNRTEGTGQRDHKNLIYRETDAVGHPALDTVLATLPSAIRCRSQARSLVPYFLSAIDALPWRSALPESLYPSSLIPGRREVGPWPLKTWGSVYPRSGWSIQPEEPKAAALTAQRAGDIVTRRNQPHLYIPLQAMPSLEQEIWPPGALIENDDTTGRWQMLAPVSDEGCQVFGLDDKAGSWANGRVDPQGDYVWNLWRPYQCCQRLGQWLLGDINWTEYPL